MAVTPSHAANRAPVTGRLVSAWPHPGRSSERQKALKGLIRWAVSGATTMAPVVTMGFGVVSGTWADRRDRKSTRLNSSHGYISYAVFCLKKKKTALPQPQTRR